MNYLKPKQRASDKRWDYTQMNDGHIWPVGYCAGWRDYTPEERKRFLMSDKWWAEHQKLKENYHSDGHATSEEACACYKKYELDTSLRFVESSSEQRKCGVCDEWTTKRATIAGWHDFVLCEKHATREEVEKVFEVGESWES